MLRYAGFISEITGKVSEEIEIHEGATLSDILKILTLKYGPRFEELILNYKMRHAPILILLNGKVVRDNFDVKLRDNDFISIMPMVSGG